MKRFWVGFLIGGTLASILGHGVMAGTVAYATRLVQIVPDTLTVFNGDSVYFRALIGGSPPGRYWWHLHGPQYIYQTPFKGVIVLKDRP